MSREKTPPAMVTVTLTLVKAEGLLREERTITLDPVPADDVRRALIMFGGYFGRDDQDALEELRNELLNRGGNA